MPLVICFYLISQYLIDFIDLNNEVNKILAYNH